MSLGAPHGEDLSARDGLTVPDGKGAKDRMTLLPQSWPLGGAAS
jgi:hypothetical protein